MNIFEEIKIRCKYKEEMMLRDYDLRSDCYKKLYSAFLNKIISDRNFREISRVFDVDYDLKEIGEIRRRVSVKNKINMR